jgi:hypothetical protein
MTEKGMVFRKESSKYSNSFTLPKRVGWCEKVTTKFTEKRKAYLRKNFAFPYLVQTDSGVHLAPIQWMPRAIPPGVKQPERKVNNSLPSRTSSWHGA